MNKYFNASFWDGILNGFVDWLKHDLPVIILILIITLVLLRLNVMLFKQINRFLVKKAHKSKEVETTEAEKRINTFTGITTALGRVLIWVVFVMSILRRLGFDLAPLLAGAGIVGLAIGFGAQELVRDFISGFFMLLENQVRTGDVVRINGTSGSVTNVELRTTTLRDFEGVVHIFQNGKINTISNLTKEWSAAVLDIEVSYFEDSDKVAHVMQQTGLEMYNDKEFSKQMIEPIEIIGVDKFATNGMVIRARQKTRPGSQWTIGREYRRRLKKAFELNNIEIPFPHTTIYWGDRIKPLEIIGENPQQK